MNSHFCDKCGKSFTTKKSLNYHINNNVCEKQKQSIYKCNNCDFSSKHKFSFERNNKKCKSQNQVINTNEPKNITNKIENLNLMNVVLKPIGKEKSVHIILNKDLWLQMIKFEDNLLCGYENYLNEVHLNKNIPENLNKHIRTTTNEMYYYDVKAPYLKVTSNENEIYDNFEDIVNDYICVIMKGYSLYKNELTKQNVSDYKSALEIISNNRDFLKEQILVHLQSYNENTIIFKKLFNDTKNNKQKRKKFLINNIENLENESILVKEIN